MLFHVVMDFVVTSSVIQISPEDGTNFMETEVLPSLDKLSKDERVLAGGAAVGSRSVAFIMEVNSAEDLQDFLQSLPMWTRMNHTVTLLQPFKSRLDHDRKLAGKLVQRFAEKKAL